MSKIVRLKGAGPGAIKVGRSANGNPGSRAFSFVDKGCLPKLPGTSYWPGPGASEALSEESLDLGKLYIGLFVPFTNLLAILY
jgi:hypothetical protein